MNKNTVRNLMLPAALTLIALGAAMTGCGGGGDLLAANVLGVGPWDHFTYDFRSTGGYDNTGGAVDSDTDLDIDAGWP